MHPNKLVKNKFEVLSTPHKLVYIIFCPCPLEGERFIHRW